jgi:hypothetical protein
MLRFRTLNESSVPPSLLPTKCPGCKMLQSSSLAMRSLFTAEVVRHMTRSSIGAVMRDRSCDAARNQKVRLSRDI